MRITVCAAASLALATLQAGLAGRCLALTAVSGWNATVAASNPLNWYRFDELSGSVAIDYGSQQLQGAYGVGALDATRGLAGLVGGAAGFGNQSTVFLNGGDLAGDWTAEFVLKRTGSKQSSVLIRGVPFEEPDTALKLEQYFNTHEFGFTQYFVTDYRFSPPVPTPLNSWVVVAYVNRPGTGMSLYLNGALAGTSTTSIALSRYQIGSDSDQVPESPLAIMDEAIIFNRALSAGEIATHFAAVPEPSSLAMAGLGLVAMWRPRSRPRDGWLNAL